MFEPGTGHSVGGRVGRSVWAVVESPCRRPPRGDGESGKSEEREGRGIKSILK